MDSCAHTESNGTDENLAIGISSIHTVKVSKLIPQGTVLFDVQENKLAALTILKVPDL